MAQTTTTTSTSSSRAPSARAFRLNTLSIFATWPRCNEKKEDVLERARAKWGEDLEFAVVCEEDHAPRPGDEQLGRHLHAVFKLKKKVNYKDPHCLDSLANSHGNYQSARSLIATVRYVAKDGDFTSFGVDVSAYLQAATAKKSTKATTMALALKSGATLRDLNEMDPGWLMMNLSKARNYIVHLQSIQHSPTLSWKVFETPLGTAQPLIRLATWLNTNLGVDRPLRQKQLLLSSPPGLGKTTLVEHLRNYFTVYSHLGGKWFDGFEEQDLIVFDEFCGAVPMTVMNKVLDGQQCLLEIKGGSVYKNKRQPVIILTNYEDHELYQGENVRQAVRDAFMDRLEYIRLPSTGAEPWRLIPFMSTDPREAQIEASSSTLPLPPSEEEDLELPSLPDDFEGLSDNELYELLNN